MSIPGTTSRGRQYFFYGGRLLVEREGIPYRVASIASIAVVCLGTRPNLFGEAANILGVAAVALLAVFVVARSGSMTHIRPALLMIAALSFLADLWRLSRALLVGDSFGAVLQGTFTTGLALLAGAVWLSDQRNAQRFLSVFCAIVVLFGLSYLVTALALTRLPLGALQLFTFPAGAFTGAVYFPFTPVVGSIGIEGQSVIRLAGLGREPGWMGMYAAVAWFVLPSVMRARWWTRILILIALLGPISTAGFGVYIVVLLLVFLLTADSSLTPFGSAMRLVAGIGGLIGAIWAALYAPVFGLDAKSTLSAASLDERSLAAAAGAKALATLSLGSQPTVQNPGLSLVSVAGQYGWPYVALLLGSLVVPLFAGVGSSRPALGALAVIVLTLLFAQPPGGSAFVWLLVMAVCSVTVDRSTPSLPPSRKF